MEGREKDRLSSCSAYTPNTIFVMYPRSLVISQNHLLSNQKKRRLQIILFFIISSPLPQWVRLNMLLLWKTSRNIILACYRTIIFSRKNIMLIALPPPPMLTELIILKQLSTLDRNDNAKDGCPRPGHLLQCFSFFKISVVIFCLLHYINT
jgi:hypothetical protein